MAAVKAGILVRVSDPGQHTDNQLSDLVTWAEHRGFKVVLTYEFQESAWKGAHQKQLTQVYHDARANKFQVLLIWALDRLSREGPLATLEIVHRLRCNSRVIPRALAGGFWGAAGPVTGYSGLGRPDGV